MKTWSAAFCGLEGCDDIITIFQPLKADVTFSTQHLFLFIMPAHHSRPVPFSQPAEGWHRWSARSDNGKILANLLQAEATRDRVGLMAALDVQIAYPQFQAYSPASFSKNLSRMKGDLGLRAAAAGGAPGAATHPGAVPIPSAVPSAMPPPPQFAGEFGAASPAAVPSPVINPFAPYEDEHGNFIHPFLLPHTLTKFINREGFKEVKFQIHNLSGANLNWTVEKNYLVGRMMMNENFTNARYSLGKFKTKSGNMLYGEHHVRRVAYDNMIREMKSPDGEIKWEMRVALPCNMAFNWVDGFEKKCISFSCSGENHIYLNLIDCGSEKVLAEDKFKPGTAAHASHMSGAPAREEESCAHSRFSYSTSTYRTVSGSPRGCGGGTPSLSSPRNPMRTPSRSSSRNHGHSGAGGSIPGHVSPDIAAAAAAGAAARPDEVDGRFEEMSITSRSRATKRSRVVRKKEAAASSAPPPSPVVDTVPAQAETARSVCTEDLS